MNDIILIGGGGHCISVIDTIEATGEYRIVGIIDKPEKVGSLTSGYEVIGTDSDLRYLHKTVKLAFITLGSVGCSKHRKRLFEECKRYGFDLPVIIDPTSIRTRRLEVGEGSYIGKGAIINREANIGRNAILNTGCIIEHNCQVGNHSHIAPGVKIGGNVIIGNSSHIGIGTTIIQNTRVGNRTRIGEASNVLKDVPANTKDFGNPCRVIETI